MLVKSAPVSKDLSDKKVEVLTKEPLITLDTISSATEKKARSTAIDTKAYYIVAKY